MNRLRRWLDQLNAYLPLLVVTLLALASWWLVKSVPALLTPNDTVPVRQDPDYKLTAFSVQTFNAVGRMTREVTGDKAQHYPATDMLHIDHVRIYAQSDSGAKINALALEGRVTDSGDLLTLTGQAYGIRHAMGDRPQLELRGEELRILPDEDQLLSDLPVQITRDRDVFTAETMDFNSNTGEYVLRGRVRGTLAPQKR
jgi:lipopolysaccharide export system protein LptC